MRINPNNYLPELHPVFDACVDCAIHNSGCLLFDNLVFMLGQHIPAGELLVTKCDLFEAKSSGQTRFKSPDDYWHRVESAGSEKSG